jgi:hypothetical protein
MGKRWIHLRGYGEVYDTDEILREHFYTQQEIPDGPLRDTAEILVTLVSQLVDKGILSLSDFNIYNYMED